MGAFCYHGNQTKRQITVILGILNCPYPSNICTKLESYCFRGFSGDPKKTTFFKIYCSHGNQTKRPLVIKHKYWVDNCPMIITAKYDLHYFTGNGENAI